MEERPRATAIQLAPAVAAAVAMAVGSLALVGWRLGITELIRVQSGLTAMRPNAAAGFMLGGLALWLLRGPGVTGASRWIALVAAWVVTILGGATLAEDLFGLNLRLDGLLYTAPVGLGEGRMAEMSATSFLLLGISLLLLPRENAGAKRALAVLAVVMGATALLTLIGYSYEVEALYEMAWFRTEALHSAAVFLVLSLGLACVHPDTGVVRLFRSDTSGGEVARRLLPAVVLLPVVLGWGVLRGEQLRGYSTGFAIALYTLLIIGVLATLVWGSARALAEADRRRLDAEAALRVQEERHRRDARFFHSVLDSLPDGVSATDLDGRLSLWNVAADPIVRLAPTGADAAERLEAYRAVHRDGSTPVGIGEFPTSRALAGETVAGFEMVVRSASPPAWLSVSASPLRDADGGVIGSVSVFRDISERRALEAQLYVADRLASVGLLAAGVAHEINNPLAVVKGNLQLLALQLGDRPQAMRMVNDSMAATDRVRQIVKDLKTLSRADSEKRVVVDVREILQSAVRVVWHDLRHRAQLVEEYEVVAPVRANEARLGQVFVNLVMNAADALTEVSGRPAEVRLRTQMRGDDLVVVEVADTGAGIAPEHRDRLFTPFFTTKPLGEGTGLGLSICHRLVSELGGEIEVDSTLGAGTTFRVLLPAVVTTQARRPRILVVDDEREIGELIVLALRESHEVRACVRGSEALEILRGDTNWDRVLVDLMMPGMSGVEFAREVARLSPELAGRIVYLSGGAFTPDAREFLAQNRRPLLEKPFDLASLRVVLGRPPEPVQQVTPAGAPAG